MKYHVYICILLLINCVLASRDSNDWRIVRQARSDERVTFHVALHQRNVQQLETRLYVISDPTSEHYGQEITKEEIIELIAPPKDEHDAVFEWFQSRGANVHSYGDALKVTMSAHTIERIFNTKLYAFEHIHHRAIRVLRQQGGMVIPEAIGDKIYMVTGLTAFPYVRRNLKSFFGSQVVPEKGEVIDYPFVSMSNIRKVYNVPPGTSAVNPKTHQCVMEFAPMGYPNPADIEQFCSESHEVYTNYTKVFGPFQPGFGDLESTLDVELLNGLGTKVPNWYYTVAANWIYEMALELFAMDQPPQVVSISFGWPEYDTCDSSITGANCNGITVAQYINRTNVELMKVGLRRVSLLACTQDEGAPGVNNVDCLNTQRPVTSIFPSSSPYVTAISATTFVPVSRDQGNEQNNKSLPICQHGFPCMSGPVYELPCASNNTYFNWTTGGGFSDMTPMPAYQAEFVAKYLNTPGVFVPPSQFFNRANRGYPEFSAVGDRILTIRGGKIDIGAGTSASTPIATALIALLNDARFEAGKSQLGFLNPLLYKMYADDPTTFNDVTSGDNRCTVNKCCEYGYGAVKGWDAVSGLGTPNFSRMRKYVTNLTGK